MPNLFEKPIAARPMSEFVALPLQFIDQSIQRRQQRYDTSKAELDMLEDRFMGTKALPKDVQRQQEILKGWMGDIDSMVDSVGGDYSQVSGRLDVIKKRINREMNYGELGSINSNFGLAMAQRASQGKAYQQGKIKDSGISLSGAAMADFQTTQKDDGSWGTFSGYTPSNIMNPIGKLQDIADEVNEKYKEGGIKYLGSDVLLNSLVNSLASDAGLKRSLYEDYGASGSKGTFEEYTATILKRIVGEKMYETTLKDAAAVKANKTGSTTMIGARFTMPTEGVTNTMVGGSVPWLKKGLESIGRNSFNEFNKWKNDPDTKERLAVMESKYGPAPEDNQELVDWVTDKYAKQTNKPIIYNPIIDDNVKARYMGPKGLLIGSGRTFNQSGKVLSKQEEIDLFTFNKENQRQGSVLGLASPDDGYPAGSIVLADSNGAQYIQEPSDAALIATDDYAVSKIISTAKSPDNRKVINLPANTYIETDKGREIFLPTGRYEIKASLNGNTFDIIQNGKVIGTYDKTTGGFSSKIEK